MLVSGELIAVLDLALVVVAGWMMKGGTPEVRARCVGTARYC